MPAGQPRIIKSPAEFDELVDAYVERCRDDEVPLTFTGMALALGFASRQSLYDYGGLPEFSYSVKRARALIEQQYETNLHGAHVAGSIFALKNHGWSDRQHDEVTPQQFAQLALAAMDAMRAKLVSDPDGDGD